MRRWMVRVFDWPAWVLARGGGGGGGGGGALGAAAAVGVAAAAAGQTGGARHEWTQSFTAGRPMQAAARFAFHVDVADEGVTYIAGNSQLAPALPAITVWKIDSAGAVAWTQTIANVAWADAYAVCVTKSANPGGPVFVSGASEGPSGKDIVTASLDDFTGAVNWQTTYNGPANGDDVPVVVKTRSDNNGEFVYVAGNSQGQSLTGASLGNDYVVIKYNALTGAPAWGVEPSGAAKAARYDGPASGDDTLVDLAIAPDGNASSGGEVGGGPGACCLPNAVCTQLTEAQCAAMEGIFFGSGVACGPGIVCPVPVRFYITGTSAGVNTGKDIATVCFNDANPFDPFDPMVVARKEWSGSDIAASLSVAHGPLTSHGIPSPFAVFVTGSTNTGTSGTYDFITLSYTPDLASERWNSAAGVGRFSGTGGMNDYARKVLYTSNRLYVVGDSFRGGIHKTDAVLIEYNPDDGMELFSLDPLDGKPVRYFPDFPEGSSEDTVSDLAIDKNGNAYFCGKFWKGTNHDIYAVSYDGMTTQRRWVEITRDLTLCQVPTGLDYVPHNGGANAFDVGVGIRLYVAGDNNHCGQVCLFGVATELNAALQAVPRYAVVRIRQCDIVGTCIDCPVCNP